MEAPPEHSCANIRVRKLPRGGGFNQDDEAITVTACDSACVPELLRSAAPAFQNACVPERRTFQSAYPQVCPNSARRRSRTNLEVGCLARCGEARFTQASSSLPTR
jgi:hypothetical protein